MDWNEWAISRAPCPDCGPGSGTVVPLTAGDEKVATGREVRTLGIRGMQAIPKSTLRAVFCRSCGLMVRLCEANPATLPPPPTPPGAQDAPVPPDPEIAPDTPY